MRNRWLVAGLVASVVANLVLVGFVVGRMSSGFAPGAGFDPTVGLPRLLRFMEDDRRRDVMRGARSARRELMPTLREIRNTQQRIHGSVIADPFEVQALHQALTEFRGKLETSQAKSHEIFAEVVARLTPAERRLLVQAMNRPPRRRDGPPPR